MKKNIVTFSFISIPKTNNTLNPPNTQNRTQFNSPLIQNILKNHHHSNPTTFQPKYKKTQPLTSERTFHNGSIKREPQTTQSSPPP